MQRRRSIFFLALLFVFAGAVHFVIPDRYGEIMPPWVPYPMKAVYLSGMGATAVAAASHRVGVARR